MIFVVIDLRFYSIFLYILNLSHFCEILESKLRCFNSFKMLQNFWSVLVVIFKYIKPVVSRALFFFRIKFETSDLDYI